MNTLKDTPTGILRHWTTGIAIIAIMLTGTFATSAEKKPLKVIILAGQSNMQKPAKWHTLKGLADSPETKPLYDKLVDENGKVRTFPNVYEAVFGTVKVRKGTFKALPPVGSPLPHGFGGKTLGGDDKGGSYGPELGFGMTLYQELQEPILIIKTAWGGKSLCGHFRPPNIGEWTPPKDHPDHPDNAEKPLPIPTSVALPKDFKRPEGRGKNMQIFVGLPVGEMNGVHPIYVLAKRNGGKRAKERTPDKFLVLEPGDLVLGLNGKGLAENPVDQWRKTFFNEIREGDWMLKITLLRNGKVMTVELDTAELLPGGRAGLKEYKRKVEEQKAAKEKELREKGGEYYQKMLERIRLVLADPGKFHPGYDPKQGYEIAGFVWFQGYNDQINTGVYPNRHKPRGFEQYSWLLAHLIRHVRKELNAPKMPVVIGAFGQGGQNGKPHPLAEAQVAVADFDEFKGTVAAVRTKQFLDPKIPEIQSRLDRVMAYDGGDPKHPYAKLQEKIRAFKEKMGDPEKLEDKREQQKLASKIEQGIIDIVQTPEDQAYLRNNVSNAGFHYNGSPKFFVRAGAAFAEALSNIIKDN